MSLQHAGLEGPHLRPVHLHHDGRLRVIVRHHHVGRLIRVFAPTGWRPVHVHHGTWRLALRRHPERWHRRILSVRSIASGQMLPVDRPPCKHVKKKKQTQATHRCTWWKVGHLPAAPASASCTSCLRGSASAPRQLPASAAGPGRCCCAPLSRSPPGGSRWPASREHVMWHGQQELPGIIIRIKTL